MVRDLITGKAVGGAAALVVAGAIASSGAIALGQDPSTTSGPAGQDLQAAIRAGSCESPGDVTAVLADLTPVTLLDASGWVGPETLQPVRVSVTELPMTLGAMARDGNAIVVEDGDGATLACGVLSGPVVDGTGLAVALLEVGGSDVSGVAVLEDLGTQATRARTFLVAGGDRVTGPDGSPEPAPSATPAGGGDDIEPDPDDIEPRPDSDIDPREDIDVDVADPAS